VLPLTRPCNKPSLIPILPLFPSCAFFFLILWAFPNLFSASSCWAVLVVLSKSKGPNIGHVQKALSEASPPYLREVSDLRQRRWEWSGFPGWTDSSSWPTSMGRFRAASEVQHETVPSSSSMLAGGGILGGQDAPPCRKRR